MVKNGDMLLLCPDPRCRNAARKIVCIQKLTQVTASSLPLTWEDAKNENAELNRLGQPDAALMEQARQRMDAQIRQLMKNADKAKDERFIESLNNPRTFWDNVQQAWLGEVIIDETNGETMIFPMPTDGDSQNAALTPVKQEQEDSQHVGGLGGVGGSAQR